MYVTGCISDWAYVTVNVTGIIVITVAILATLYILTKNIRDK